MEHTCCFCDMLQAFSSHFVKHLLSISSKRQYRGFASGTTVINRFGNRRDPWKCQWLLHIPIDNYCSVYNLHFCFFLLCFGNCSGSILGLTVCRLACLKGYTKKYRDHGCLRMVSDHFNLFYVCCIWGYKTFGLFS